MLRFVPADAEAVAATGILNAVIVVLAAVDVMIADEGHRLRPLQCTTAAYRVLQQSHVSAEAERLPHRRNERKIVVIHVRDREMSAEPGGTIRDELAERVLAGHDGEHVGEKVGLYVLGSIKAVARDAQACKFRQVVLCDLAHVLTLGLEVQEVVRKPAPLGRIVAGDVAPVVKVLRGELRKVVLDDSIAFDPNEARRRLVEINSVVKHDINQYLDAVRRGSRCHCPKLSLASERALNLCEIHRLVAAPPLPHPLVALLRRRDMHMAVTQRSQHRDYLPDGVKAPIEELNDNVAVLGLWDTGCDARHLCAAHTGKQQADDQKPARGWPLDESYYSHWRIPPRPVPVPST